MAQRQATSVSKKGCLHLPPVSMALSEEWRGRSLAEKGEWVCFQGLVADFHKFGIWNKAKNNVRASGHRNCKPHSLEREVPPKGDHKRIGEHER